MGPNRHMALVSPVPNLHVKLLIFSARPDEGAESHFLQGSDWADSKGIVEEGKCARFCLTLAGDVSLWYESTTLVGSYWDNLQRLFCRQFSK